MRTALLLLAAAFGVAPVLAQDAVPPGPGAPETIVVNAERFRVETLIDRKVYRVADDLQGLTGAVTDVLGAIPSVEVDADGVVALRGDTNVLILIDGHPVAQLSGAAAGDSLQQIPAQDLEKIEVITNPPAQYKAEGTAGIINIVTRKSGRPGVSGTLNANVGNDRRYVLGGSGNYRAGGLRISGSASLRGDERQRQSVSTLLAPDPSSGAPTASSNTLEEHLRRRTPVVKAAVDYDLAARQSLGYSFNRVGRTGDRDFEQTSASGPPAGAPTSASVRDSAGHEWSDDIDQRLTYERRFAQADERLTITLQRSTYREREHFGYVNDSLLPAAAPTRDDLNLREDLQSREISVDYALPLPRGGRLDLGYDVEADDNGYGNAGDNIDPATDRAIPNPAITNDFRYLQQVNALYASWDTSVGAWNAKSGVRWEATRNEARLITNGLSAAHAYAGLYPSVHLERALSTTQTLSFAANRRLARPDPGLLDPYVDRQDTNNLRAGNPNLLAQDTRAFEAAYAVETRTLHYSLAAYYRLNHNGVTDVTQVVATDVVLVTKANLPRADSGGLEFTLDGTPLDGLRAGISGNLFHSRIDASALGYPGLRSTTGLNAKATLDYHFTPEDSGQLVATRSDKRLTPQGYVGAIDLVNAGYRHRVNAALAAVATVSDIFNGQTFTRHVQSPGLTDSYRRHVAGRTVYVGVVYAFGRQGKAEAERFEFDQ